MLDSGKEILLIPHEHSPPTKLRADKGLMASLQLVTLLVTISRLALSVARRRGQPFIFHGHGPDRHTLATAAGFGSTL
jgi:hypothetical protein